VWLYKGEILPYKSLLQDKASAEAAMAVGDTAGSVRPRQVVSSAARRQRDEVVAGAAPADAEAEVEVAPLVKEADPELERLLAEEEEIERSTRESSETPHFRGGDD
jgi:small subunit ribosomal protein S3